MFINIDRYITFLENNKLTQAQFMMCYLIYRRRYDMAKQFSLIYPVDDGTFIGKGAKEDLVERGYLVKIGENETLADYEVGLVFKKVFVDKYEIGDQFWDMYPSMVSINGVSYPLTLMDKYDFRNIYAERIGYDLHEHEEVMKDLEFGIKKSLVKCGIEKFLRSEQWSAIRKIRTGQQTITIDNTITTHDL